MTGSDDPCCLGKRDNGAVTLAESKSKSKAASFRYEASGMVRYITFLAPADD